MLVARSLQYLTPPRLLAVTALATLGAAVATPFLSDIDGVTPWSVVVLAVVGAFSSVLLAGTGVLVSGALSQADWFRRAEISEIHKWIRWFESERIAHSKKLDEHGASLTRIEAKLDELLRRGSGAQ